MSITGSEAAIIGSAITATGWSMAAKWQHKGSKTVEDIHKALVDLGDRLTAHTADDARNFDALRAELPRRRRRLLPAVGMILAFLFVRR